MVQRLLTTGVLRTHAQRGSRELQTDAGQPACLVGRGPVPIGVGLGLETDDHAVLPALQAPPPWVVYTMVIILCPESLYLFRKMCISILIQSGEDFGAQ